MKKLFSYNLLIDVKKKLNLLFLLMLIGVSINHIAWARGGHSGGGSVIGGGGGGFSGGGHRHYGHSHGHSHGHHHHLGIGFGGFYGPGFFGPGFYGPGFYGYPYSYGYRYPRYYASPFVAPSAPTVYIQRETPVAPSAQPATTNYWYYCRNPEGYYPYVKTCPEGWLQVAPQPAPQ